MNGYSMGFQVPARDPVWNAQFSDQESAREVADRIYREKGFPSIAYYNAIDMEWAVEVEFSPETGFDLKIGDLLFFSPDNRHAFVIRYLENNSVQFEQHSLLP